MTQNLSNEDRKLKKTLFLTIEDSVKNFLFYDRREDEDLSTDTLFRLIASEAVTRQEILEAFDKNLTQQIEKYL